MIDRAFIRKMARYNRWQNQSLYGAAETLSDEQRRQDQGAFFGSIHRTLSHILWGDQVWMSRFDNQPPPKGRLEDSMLQWEDWGDLKAASDAMDALLLDWSERVDAAWLAGDYSWHSGALNRTLSRPAWGLVVHMFNHQTHHRGQVHVMLSQTTAPPPSLDMHRILNP